jgi:hypothetical protein
MAEVIKVICVCCTRGKGISDDDPCRMVTQYWSLDGVLLAERDPVRTTDTSSAGLSHDP